MGNIVGSIYLTVAEAAVLDKFPVVRPADCCQFTHFPVWGM